MSGWANKLAISQLLLDGTVLSLERPCGIFVCAECNEDFACVLPDWPHAMDLSDYFFHTYNSRPDIILIGIHFCPECVSERLSDPASLRVALEKQDLYKSMLRLQHGIHTYVVQRPAILKAPCKDWWAVLCFLRDYDTSELLQQTFTRQQKDSQLLITLNNGKNTEASDFAVTVNLEGPPQ